MRRHLLLLLAVSLVAAVGIPTGAAAQIAGGSTVTGSGYQTKHESGIVHTKFGDIYLEVDRPVTSDGKDVNAPAILTYSPYSILWVGLCGQRACDADHWVSQGYARVWADVVGTGNSGGCWDYGGPAEQQTGYDIVEWIAKQKWSTGKVGMIGGSYEGTTAWATAITNPPHLTTIIPEAAIARWYDYAFSDGIRYSWNNEWAGNEGPGAAGDEGIDTPLGFDFGLQLPPPLDPQDPAWGDRVASNMQPCNYIENTQHGYNVDTPTYDKFWKQRDYLMKADKIDIPVMISANWGDWNVKQEESLLMYRALKNAANLKLYMGTRWEGHGTPGGDYAKAVDAWFAHYLQGADNGAQNMPDVTSQESDHMKPIGWYSGAWPKTTDVSLVAQETPVTDPSDYAWKLLPMKPMPSMLLQPDVATFNSVGANLELHMNHHPRLNHEWFWFESPILKRDVRIFGAPKVQIYSTVDRKWITYTPEVVDVDPKQMVMVANNHVGWTDTNALIPVTRGFLDSRYRDGLGKTVPIKAGKPQGLTVVEKPTDYTFRKGHFIGLQIATEVDEWTVPKPYPCQSAACPKPQIDWTKGKTRLILPIVDAPKDPMDLFDMGGMHMHM